MSLLVSSGEGDAANAEIAAATAAAMEAAFGTDWENTLKLKYDAWKAEALEVYKTSSFAGHETDMIAQVGKLTDSLQTYLSGATGGIGGTGLAEFATANGIDLNDEGAMANAAVSYVASRNNALTDEQRQKFLGAVSTAGTSDWNANAAMNTIMNDVYGGSALPTAAAVYAMMAAMGQYQATNYPGDSTQINNILADINFDDLAGLDSGAASAKTLEILGAKMGEVMAAGDTAAWINDYMSNQLSKDMNAYLSVMDMVKDNESELLSHATENNLYDDDGPAESLLNEYLNGSIYAIDVPEGTVIVTLTKTGNSLKAISSID